MVEESRVGPDHRILEVTFKEKEPKVNKAQGYCKMTFEMRPYQTATEKNIAESIFPFIFQFVKYQSMTMSERSC